MSEIIPQIGRMTHGLLSIRVSVKKRLLVVLSCLLTVAGYWVSQHSSWHSGFAPNISASDFSFKGFSRNNSTRDFAFKGFARNISARDFVFKESDLVYSQPVPLNFQLLRRAHLIKTEELKRRKAWKKIDERRPCSKDTPPNNVCIDKNCTSTLPPVSSDANFRSVFKPLARVKDVYGRLFDSLGPFKGYSDVIFASAASSNHYMESQALMRNLHDVVFPHLLNFTFYFYDLGLTSHERQQMEKHCRCEVRTFPFHILPKRFRFLRGFTWKAIITQALLPHANVLVWVDTSIRFLTGSLRPLFDQARSAGLVMSNYRGEHVFMVGQFASKTMFDYFDDAACTFDVYVMLDGGFLVMHNDPYMREVVFRTWLACALDPLCMHVDQNAKELYCNQWVRRYSKCHRDDQAAMSIVLVKLFREHVHSFYVPVRTYHTVKRGQSADYFAALDKKALSSN